MMQKTQMTTNNEKTATNFYTFNNFGKQKDANEK